MAIIAYHNSDTHFHLSSHLPIAVFKRVLMSPSFRIFSSPLYPRSLGRMQLKACIRKGNIFFPLAYPCELAPDRWQQKGVTTTRLFHVKHKVMSQLMFPPHTKLPLQNHSILPRFRIRTKKICVDLHQEPYSITFSQLQSSHFYVPLVYFV